MSQGIESNLGHRENQGYDDQAHGMKNLARVRWRCRRGLLELDILLGRFVDTHYAKLSKAELHTFEVLLDMPDNPLWDMISGKQDSKLDEQKALLEKIKSV